LLIKNLNLCIQVVGAVQFKVGKTLQDLANRRDLTVYLGDPYEFAQENPVAVTYAPVPSFVKFKNLAQIHPFPWLKSPHSLSIKSFSAWRSKLK